MNATRSQPLDRAGARRKDELEDALVDLRYGDPRERRAIETRSRPSTR